MLGGSIVPKYAAEKSKLTCDREFRGASGWIYSTLSSVMIGIIYAIPQFCKCNTVFQHSSSVSSNMAAISARDFDGSAISNNEYNIGLGIDESFLTKYAIMNQYPLMEED